MPPPNLSDFTDALDERVRDYLGETIQYAADGITFAGVKAHVFYRDMLKPLDVGDAIAQDITIEGLLKSDVATKPNGTARVTLARLPGKTFKAINVRTDDSGTGWDFELQRVSG